jgi:hypothetical protein
MIQKIPAEKIYISDEGWHTGRFHFSFADYDDPENLQFGVLSALNDFVLAPGTGFETHPHDEMEIISYCVEGELTHGDGMGHGNKLQSGDVQYICAGSGITHSEMNELGDCPMRFLQIWITPNERNLKPKYQSERYSKVRRMNELQHLVSGESISGVIEIAQDANIYAGRLENGKQLTYKTRDARQGYLVCLEGRIGVNQIELGQSDALKIWGEDMLRVSGLEQGHFLLVEMAAE